MWDWIGMKKIVFLLKSFGPGLGRDEPSPAWSWIGKSACTRRSGGGRLDDDGDQEWGMVSGYVMVR